MKTIAADGGELLETLHPWLALNILNGWLVVRIGSRATVNQVWIFSGYSTWMAQSGGLLLTMLVSLQKGIAVSPAAGTA